MAMKKSLFLLICLLAPVSANAFLPAESFAPCHMACDCSPGKTPSQDFCSDNPETSAITCAEYCAKAKNNEPVQETDSLSV